MSKFKLALLCLFLIFLMSVITAFSNPPPEFPQPHLPPPPSKSNPDYPVEKVNSPSLTFLSLNSRYMSVIEKTSELAKTIIITKITPRNGEIILNNTNNTMPANVSGWHLEILSINHPGKEVIANGSVISPMGQLAVSILPLDSSGVASLADSTGKIVDRVPYAGNWTKVIKL